MKFFAPGRRPLIRDLNKLARERKRLDNRTIAVGGGVNRFATGPQVLFETPQVIRARITGDDGTGHSWEEVRPASYGEWETFDGGMTGTVTQNPAYDVNGHVVAAGQVVKLRRGSSRISAGQWVTEWLFANGCCLIPSGGGSGSGSGGFITTECCPDLEIPTTLAYELVIASCCAAINGTYTGDLKYRLTGHGCPSLHPNQHLWANNADDPSVSYGDTGHTLCYGDLGVIPIAVCDVHPLGVRLIMTCNTSTDQLEIVAKWCYFTTISPLGSPIDTWVDNNTASIPGGSGDSFALVSSTPSCDNPFLFNSKALLKLGQSLASPFFGSADCYGGVGAGVFCDGEVTISEPL